MHIKANTTKIYTATINGLKTAGIKVKDGTLFVTDSLEHGVDKTTDKVSGAFLHHRNAHADRMRARLIARDERKAAKASK